MNEMRERLIEIILKEKHAPGIYGLLVAAPVIADALISAGAVLPEYKIGDTVYFVGAKKPIKCVVEGFTFEPDGFRYWVVWGNIGGAVSGDKLFHTEAEARAALEGK